MKKENNAAKKRALHREKVIKKRIEMLLKSAAIGLVTGIAIGIVLPIGGIKKSEYKLLQESNKNIEEKLQQANSEISALKSKLEQSSVFTSLNDDQREQVVAYIGELKEDKNEDVSTIQTTEMFNRIYKGYAYSVGYVSFEDFNTIVDTLEFKYEIIDNNKFIFKESEGNDSVILTFSKNEGSEDLILNSVLYKKDNKHIEAKNNDSIIEYKTYDGSERTVNNINDQIKFLFS